MNNYTLFSEESIEAFPYIRFNSMRKNDYKKRSRWHKHTFWEFGVVFAGAFTNESENKLLTCTRGTAFLLRPDDIHSFFFNTEKAIWQDIYVSDTKMESICKSFSPFLYDKLKNAEDFSDFIIAPNRLTAMEEEFNFINTRFVQKNPELDILHTSLAYSFIGGYLQSIFAKEAYPADLKPFLEQIQKPENMSLSLDEIFAQFPYSHSYICRLFKQHFNKTARSCFIENKINFAAKLLLNSKSSIGDIAYTVGYENEKYFIKYFKSLYGITPHQWRLSHQQIR